MKYFPLNEELKGTYTENGKGYNQAEGIPAIIELQIKASICKKKVRKAEALSLKVLD